MEFCIKYMRLVTNDKKFTRFVLIVVIPISLITGCGLLKTEAQKPKAVQTEKRTIWITHMVAKVY